MAEALQVRYWSVRVGVQLESLHQSPVLHVKHLELSVRRRNGQLGRIGAATAAAHKGARVNATS